MRRRKRSFAFSAPRPKDMVSIVFGVAFPDDLFELEFEQILFEFEYSNSSEICSYVLQCTYKNYVFRAKLNSIIQRNHVSRAINKFECLRFFANRNYINILKSHLASTIQELERCRSNDQHKFLYQSTLQCGPLTFTNRHSNNFRSVSFYIRIEYSKQLILRVLSNSNNQKNRMFENAMCSESFEWLRIFLQHNYTMA